MFFECDVKLGFLLVIDLLDDRHVPPFNNRSWVLGIKYVDTEISVARTIFVGCIEGPGLQVLHHLSLAHHQTAHNFEWGRFTNRAPATRKILPSIAKAGQYVKQVILY